MIVFAGGGKGKRSGAFYVSGFPLLTVHFVCRGRRPGDTRSYIPPYARRLGEERGEWTVAGGRGREERRGGASVFSRERGRRDDDPYLGPREGAGNLQAELPRDDKVDANNQGGQMRHEPLGRRPQHGSQVRYRGDERERQKGILREGGRERDGEDESGSQTDHLSERQTH